MPLATTPETDKSPAELRADLVRLLTDRERRVLAAYVYDGQTQAEIAEAEGRSQASVCSWLRQIAAKLAAEGLGVTMSRTVARSETVRVDPAHMDDLVLDGPRGTGARARWVKGSDR